MKIRWLFCLTVCICILLLPGTASSTLVSRSVEPFGDGGEGTFSVTLAIQGMETGGIVEYLPEGCAVMHFDHPANRTRVGDHQVAFAITDATTTLSYTVRGDTDTPDLITGTWLNLLEGTNGTVGSGPVTHTGPSSTEAASTTTAPLSLFPAIGAVSILLAVVSIRRGLQ
jgi:hypothetical protein